MTTKSRKSQSQTHGLVKNAHYVLLGIMISFIVAALVFGEIFGAYKTFWWWDDMLHTISGVIVGFVGFMMVYFFNARYNMTISPLFVAVFAFTFAMTIGVAWEVFEFTIDAVFQANMQRWLPPEGAVLIGRDYQGFGLRDTMSDLMVSWLGAALVSVFAYFAYKHEKQAVLGVMRRTFPWKKPRRK